MSETCDPVARRHRPIVCAIGLIATIALVACGRDQPTAPPGRYSLTGRVRLTGYLVNASAQFAGTRVVDDADGVAVDLLYGTTVIGHTTTVGGRYTFGGLAPGAYQTRARVMGNFGDRSNVLTIVASDLTAGDTLRLPSIGDLYPYPNPSSSTVEITYRLLDTAFVELRIRNLQGTSIRLLRSSLQTPMVQQQHWDGLDDAFQPVTGSLYWLTLESGIDQRAQLLFR